MTGPEFETHKSSHDTDPAIPLTAQDPAFVTPEIAEIDPKDLGGMDLIDYYNHRYPEYTLINMAMAAETCLRYTKDVIATGHEVQFARAPSQAFLIDILLSMPLINEARTPAANDLLVALKNIYTPSKQKNTAETATEGVGTNQALLSFLCGFAQTVQHYTAPLSSLNTSLKQPTIEERQYEAANMNPLIKHMRLLFQRVLDPHFDARRLAHEGADIEGSIPVIYEEFIDSDVMKLLGNPAELGQPSGLSGQVRLRIIQECSYLLAIERYIIELDAEEI